MKPALKKILLMILLAVSLHTVNAQQRYYWVGKGDKTSWSDLMNWSASSGGLGGLAGGITIVPTTTTTVVFDQNSTLLTDRWVTTGGSVTCDSLIVANCTASTLPVFNIINSTYTLTINGSLFLQSGVTFRSGYHAPIIFASNRAEETIDINDNNLSASVNWITAPSTTNGNRTNFSGTAVYKLANNTNFAEIAINAGATLDLNGKNIFCHSITTNSTGNIKFAGSVVDCRYSWSYSTGTPTLTTTETANSLIRIGTYNFTAKANDQYNEVEFYAGNTMSQSARTMSFGSYKKVTVKRGGLTLSSVTIDSLLIQTTGYIDFRSVTVNNYLEAKPAVCGGQVKLFSYWRGIAAYVNDARGEIALGASATTLIERAVIYDLGISRTVNAAKSYNWGNVSGFNFTTSPDAGRDMYWIKGGGDWCDPAHWALDAAGTTPANCIPTLADNVFFNANANLGGTAISGSNPIHCSMDIWCNDLTFNGVPGSPVLLFRGSPPDTTFYTQLNVLVHIGGSMTLQPPLSFEFSGFQYQSMDWTTNQIFFVSNDANETITTNGVAVPYDFVFQSINGNGKWKFMDDLVLFSSTMTTTENVGSATGNYILRSIYLNRGGLDFSGHKYVIRRFACKADNTLSGFSELPATRSLNIADATMDIFVEWSYLGGQQLTAAQSANSEILMGGDGYTTVTATRTNDYYHNITLRKKGGTFSSTENPAGYYCHFNKITLDCTAATLQGGTSTELTLRPDSLRFIGYGTYTINKSMNVNEYIGTSLACGGSTQITASNPITITIGTTIPVKTDRVQIRNTTLNNISITPDTPYSITDCTLTGTSNGWTVSSSPAMTSYWVGGTGNWSDVMHWANSSGGTPGSGCIPRAIDNVIFDNNSFSAAGQTVTIDGPSYCDSMSWIGAASLRPILSFVAYKELYIAGSLLLQTNMRVDGQDGRIHFTTNRANETITTNGVNVQPNYLYFQATNKAAGWILADDLIQSGCCPNVYFDRGTLNLNGKLMRTHAFYGNTSTAGSDRSTRKLILTNATLDLPSSNGGGYYYYTGELYADNSTISTNFTTNGTITVEPGAQYHNLYIKGTAAWETVWRTITYGKYNKIQTDRGNVVFNGIETDTLILGNNAEDTYKFTSDSTLRVNEAFYGSGTPCNPIFLQSTTENKPAIFDIKKAAANMPDDTLMIDYAYIHGIKAVVSSNNAKLYKAFHSPDVVSGGSTWAYGLGSGTANAPSANTYNQNWARMDVFQSGGTTPFGDDFYLNCEQIPYHLTAVNFMPTPGATFEWRKDDANGELISTDSEIFINESGAHTIWLQVSFANGCVSSDDVVITVENVPAVSVSIHTPAVVCAGQNLTLPTPEVVNSSSVPQTGWQIETGVNSGEYVAFVAPYIAALADNGKRVRYVANNACGPGYSNAEPLTVTNCAVPSPLCTCAGSYLDMSVPTLQARGGTISASGWQIENSAGSNTFVALTLPYSLHAQDNGKKVRYYATSEYGTGYSNNVVLEVNCCLNISGLTTVQVGTDITLFGSGGTTWSSANTAIATVSATGQVHGVATGSVRLTYSNPTTGCSMTYDITVTP